MKFSLIALAMLVSTPALATSGEVYRTECEANSKNCEYSVVLAKKPVPHHFATYVLTAKTIYPSSKQSLSFDYVIDCDNETITDKTSNTKLTEVPGIQFPKTQFVSMIDATKIDMKAAWIYTCYVKS